MKEVEAPPIEEKELTIVAEALPVVEEYKAPADMKILTPQL